MGVSTGVQRTAWSRGRKQKKKGKERGGKQGKFVSLEKEGGENVGFSQKVDRDKTKTGEA